MHRIIFAIAFLLSLATGTIQAQVRPTEGSQLNYRIVGLWFPAAATPGTYKIEIADGYYNDPALFQENITRTLTTKTNSAIAEVPQFGKPYTWRITYNTVGHAATQSGFYHFYTGTLPSVDTHATRLRILKKATKYAGAYVFCDKSRAMYTLDGAPVWYLPNLPGIVRDDAEVRDLKISPKGTITFVVNNKAYEINYSGEVIWEPPNDGEVSGDIEERYHHELTVLSNGHYMVLGNELVAWEWAKNAPGDSSLRLVTDEQLKNAPGKVYPKISFGTVIEYDTAGKVVWSWKSSTYYRQTTLLHNKTVKNIFDSHENAFYFDEKRKNVYVSFKNFSQLMKIKYPEGKVTNVYGNTSDTDTLANTLFCHQHSCKVSKKGYPYLFNNNICHPEKTPTVVLMQEPASGKGNLTKIWEYSYPYKGDFTEKRKAEGTSGGNAIELPGGEMLVSMCNPYGNVFIVNKEKQLLWDALLEKWNDGQKKWVTQSAYRYSIITSRKNLEHLIRGENIDRQ